MEEEAHGRFALHLEASCPVERLWQVEEALVGEGCLVLASFLLRVLLFLPPTLLLLLLALLLALVDHEILVVWEWINLLLGCIHKEEDCWRCLSECFGTMANK
jgi:hypothetical protein